MTHEQPHGACNAGSSQPNEQTQRSYNPGPSQPYLDPETDFFNNLFDIHQNPDRREDMEQQECVTPSPRHLRSPDRWSYPSNYIYREPRN